MLAVRDQDHASDFLRRLLDGLSALGVDFHGMQCDHLCYRVQTVEEYDQLKSEIASLGSSVAVLLSETLIGGRPIATFKFLDRPVARVVYADMAVYEPYLLELPSPKQGSPYAQGFEHAEFVLKPRYPGGLVSFIDAHKQIRELETDDMTKELNPDVRIRVSPNLSAKFHCDDLATVIQWELGHASPQAAH